MSRLMSVAMTTDAVIERRKTVTRRKGWTFLKVGDTLTLCRKVQGRRYRALDGTWKVTPLERLAEVWVYSINREPLGDILRTDISNNAGEVEREGFPGMSAEVFVRRFFIDAQGMNLNDTVTRIEWCYLDAEVTR